MAPAFHEGERVLSWDHVAYKRSKQVTPILRQGGQGQTIRKNLKRGAQAGKRETGQHRYWPKD